MGRFGPLDRAGLPGVDVRAVGPGLEALCC